MDDIDGLIALYEKRLSTLKAMKSLMVSDPNLAAEAIAALTGTVAKSRPKSVRQPKKTQFEKMCDFLGDGRWHTVADIAAGVGADRNSIAPYFYREPSKERFESRKLAGHRQEWRLKDKASAKESSKEGGK